MRKKIDRHPHYKQYCCHLLLRIPEFLIHYDNSDCQITINQNAESFEADRQQKGSEHFKLGIMKRNNAYTKASDTGYSNTTCKGKIYTQSEPGLGGTENDQGLSIQYKYQ